MQGSKQDIQLMIICISIGAVLAMGYILLERWLARKKSNKDSFTCTNSSNEYYSVERVGRTTEVYLDNILLESRQSKTLAGALLKYAMLKRNVKRG